MTRSLRDFVPLTENVVNMYVCGPTVYNYIHIGNARSAVAFDTIRRYFEYCGYTVNYISNFTDVDDKIIKAANEAGISTKELSDKFIAAFMEDTGQLGIKPSMVEGQTLSFHTIPMKLPNPKPKLARPLLTTGCIMVLSMWIMKKCQNPWVTS